MAIDLSALGGGKTAPVEKKAEPAKPTGKPYMLKLADIEPDPNQPRTEKSEEDIADIGASIKARNVKLPISVRKHPEKPGKWLINDGEMRYLGSLWADKKEIPVVVDEDFDDFDQVNLNEKRYQLSPMQLGKFVLSKITAGVKKGDIAEKLGKPSSQITELAALAKSPKYILEIYEKKVCTSPSILYRLIKLGEKYPIEVPEWAKSREQITRIELDELAANLENPAEKISASRKNEDGSAGVGGGSAGEDFSASRKNEDGSAGAGGGSAGEDFSASRKNEDGSAGAGGGSAGEDFSASRKNEDGSAGDESSKTTQAPFHNPANEKNQNPQNDDPNKLKKPLLLVEFEGRAAMVLLSRRPSSAGMLWIRFEDTGQDEEVAGVDCLINMLTDETGKA